MPTLTTPAGILHYRTAGPADATSPPVVFVHGFLVDSTLWDPVAHGLAAAGVRSYLVDWPLGSHRMPMSPDAELGPAAVAELIGHVLEALGLDDVTIVGNDTGGAICQLLVADKKQRRVGAAGADQLRRLRELSAEGVCTAVRRSEATVAHRCVAGTDAATPAPPLAPRLRDAPAAPTRRRPHPGLDHARPIGSPHPGGHRPIRAAASIAAALSLPNRVFAASTGPSASSGVRPTDSSRSLRRAASSTPSRTPR